MSSTTVSNSSNNAINTMTFAEGRALEECTGGVNKHALAEAKKQEKEKKQQEAAMKKALKEAEKQRKAEAKAEKDAEKKRKADEKAAKQLEKQRKAEEKEAKKQKKIQEKAAKADALAKKKEEKQRKNDEKEAEKQRKLHEKALKAEAAAAKKAERDAKKADRDAKKAEREAKKVKTQVDESKPANIQVECLQNPVSDQEAEKVSEIAINTTNSPIQNENIVVLDETLVQTSLDLEIPCEVPTNTPVDFGSDEELETNSSSELTSKIIKIEEEEECENKNNTTFESVDELSEEEWEKEIHGDETDTQKIVRLRKEAFSLLGRALKLEKSLPTNVSDDVEKEKDKDMREIEGIWYHVDSSGYIFNRSDELVGFMDNDEFTFTPGWSSTRGTWDYE